MGQFGGLFAAKEAVLKALGTGWGSGAWFRDVEIVRAPGAGPTVRLHDGALRRAREMGVARVHVSITHERGHAAAVAVLGFKGFWRAVGEYLGNATNQQAEIAAAALGLSQLKERCRVKVLSDSRYVVETMTGNFRKKTNHEWWARLERAASKHEIEWQWIKGHAGHEIQEVADKAARKRAAKERGGVVSSCE